MSSEGFDHWAEATMVTRPNAMHPRIRFISVF
jgi:hypothetical protein